MAAVGPGMLRRPHMHGFLTGEGGEIPATMRASAALEEVHSYRDRMVRPRPPPLTLNPGPYTLNPAPCTLHPEPWTLNPGPYTLHPEPWTLHPEP